MGDEANVISDMLPFLIPLIILELALMVIGLIDLFRREYVTGGNKLVWAILIIVIGVIGPAIYFIFGRQEKPIDSD